ncbi:hypothetical protein [Pleomorphomonas sp. PLEO]|uniref:hypothetical protein n=1 Tax=Pleomorphomonas sp. PLEO TaxID=3239306 RepID=UPI00351E18FE
MTLPNARTRRIRRSWFAGCFLAIPLIGVLWTPSLGHAADATGAQKIAAQLNIPRRAWTICTVNEIGHAIQAEQATDVMAIADGALVHCAGDEQALRTKAVELLGANAAGRLMERLVAEARDALVGSARTLQAAKASGSSVDPAWPRVLAPTR